MFRNFISANDENLDPAKRHLLRLENIILTLTQCQVLAVLLCHARLNEEGKVLSQLTVFWDFKGSQASQADGCVHDLDHPFEHGAVGTDSMTAPMTSGAVDILAIDDVQADKSEDDDRQEVS
jgi:hypothetical protein